MVRRLLQVLFLLLTYHIPDITQLSPDPDLDPDD